MFYCAYGYNIIHFTIITKLHSINYNINYSFINSVIVSYITDDLGGIAFGIECKDNVIRVE